MKSALFITVRIDSSRFSNKAVKEILGRPVLEMIILRAKQAKKFDEVVVCTSTRIVDDRIEEIALKNGVKVFRGSLEDKLDRWYQATRKYNIDYIVTFDGDDLFCEPELLDMGLEQIMKGECDFIEAPQGLITGAFTYAFTAKALRKVCEIKASEDTEMMWTYFKDSGFFKTGVLENVDEIFFNNIMRMTLDYPEDFEYFINIFDHFKCYFNEIPLREIVNYLLEYPEINDINYGCQEKFLENQKRKTKLVLIQTIKGEAK